MVVLGWVQRQRITSLLLSAVQSWSESRRRPRRSVAPAMGSRTRSATIFLARSAEIPASLSCAAELKLADGGIAGRFSTVPNDWNTGAARTASSMGPVELSFEVRKNHPENSPPCVRFPEGFLPPRMGG